jgi:hypothetical protein
MDCSYIQETETIPRHEGIAARNDRAPEAFLRSALRLRSALSGIFRALIAEARRPAHLVLKELARALEEFATYIDNNASGIVN